MTKATLSASLVGVLLFSLPAFGQAEPETPASAPQESQSPQDPAPSFQGVDEEFRTKLDAAIAEYAALQDEVTSKTLEQSRALRELDAQLKAERERLLKTIERRELATVKLSTVRQEIKLHKRDLDYLVKNFRDYIQPFSDGLHVVELKRAAVQEPLNANRLVAQKTNADTAYAERIAAQKAVVHASVERLEEILGGTSFAASAVDPLRDSRVVDGRVVLVGPAAVFVSDDGKSVGLAQRVTGASEPSIQPFGNEELNATARSFVASLSGDFPFDPTLGDAYKLDESTSTLLEQVEKGGNVIWPILVLGGLALLAALYKWIALARLPKVRRSDLARMMELVANGEGEEAARRAGRLRGPVGKMLAAGVDHLGTKRELVEEVMYERILNTRLRLQRVLPFIAVTAASAPLLGLLGTVTGIISTFDKISAFGSSDVKNISGGISEALITTEFGLIVAIPALLIHAFLSRKAKGIVGRMETTALNFINQVDKAGGFQKSGTSGSGDPDALRNQVNEILNDLITTPAASSTTSPARAASA